MEEAKKECVVKTHKVLDIAIYENIKLNAGKTVIACRDIETVGRGLNGKGKRLLKRHQTNVLDIEWEALRNKTDLLSYNGMVRYVGTHCPGVETDLFMLTDFMLKPAMIPKFDNPKMKTSEKNKRIILVRSAEAKEVFDRIRERVKNALILHPPDMRTGSPFHFLLIVDVSKKKIGATLMMQDPTKKPVKMSEDQKMQTKLLEDYNLIAFAVKMLSDAQQRYGATKRELVGIVYAVKKFKRYLTICHFYMMGDCKQIQSLFRLNNQCGNDMLMRWRRDVCTMGFEFFHRAGRLLYLTDWLSRYGNETEPKKKKTEKPKASVFALINFLMESNVTTDNPSNDNDEMEEISEILSFCENTNIVDKDKWIKSTSDREQRMNEVIVTRNEYISDLPDDIRSIVNINKIEAKYERNGNVELDEIANPSSKIHALKAVHQQIMQRAHSIATKDHQDAVITAPPIIPSMYYKKNHKIEVVRSLEQEIDDETLISSNDLIMDANINIIDFVDKTLKKTKSQYTGIDPVRLEKKWNAIRNKKEIDYKQIEINLKLETNELLDKIKETDRRLLILRKEHK